MFEVKNTYFFCEILRQSCYVFLWLCRGRLDEFKLLPSASDDGRKTELYRNKSADVRRWLQDKSSKRPDKHHAALPNVLFEAATAGIDTRLLDDDKTIDKIRNITRLRRRGRERGFAIAQCVFNSVDAAAWLIRAFLSIHDAARSCGDRKAPLVAISTWVQRSQADFGSVSETVSQAADFCHNGATSLDRLGPNTARLHRQVRRIVALPYTEPLGLGQTN